jgi:hypothetical protein
MIRLDGTYYLMQARKENAGSDAPNWWIRKVFWIKNTGNENHDWNLLNDKFRERYGTPALWCYPLNYLYDLSFYKVKFKELKRAIFVTGGKPILGSKKEATQ